MKKFYRYIPWVVFAVFIAFHSFSYAQQMRFPRPEFETGYTYPTHQYINQRGPMWEYMDVAVLVVALLLTAWFAIRKRSREGILWVSLFSLAYFGFYRQGCICAVGSVQNVSMALFNSDYGMPLPALMFFVIPLVAALFFGRVFCTGVCPLGAIQELTGFRMVKINRNVEMVLTTIPFIYLGLAVLYASTESQFIICRYDPFVGFFRFGGPYTIIIFGILLLLVGIFVNRPYCRYLCPYGVLQNIFSRFSFRHLTITPAECRNCRLCEPSCPYDAILQSDPVKKEDSEKATFKSVWPALLLTPVLAGALALFFYNISPALAVVNDKVALAKEIRLEKEQNIKAVSKGAIAFYESGKTEAQLFEEEEVVLGRFRKGAPWVGVFLGLSLGLGLFFKSTREPRTEYEPDRGRCVSCGKCFKYCPVKVKL